MSSTSSAKHYWQDMGAGAPLDVATWTISDPKATSKGVGARAFVNCANSPRTPIVFQADRLCAKFINTVGDDFRDDAVHSIESGEKIKMVLGIEDVNCLNPEIVIPEGKGPGDEITVNFDNLSSEIITIPDNKTSGDVITIQTIKQTDVWKSMESGIIDMFFKRKDGFFIAKYQKMSREDIAENFAHRFSENDYGPQLKVDFVTEDKTESTKASYIKWIQTQDDDDEVIEGFINEKNPDGSLKFNALFSSDNKTIFNKRPKVTLELRVGCLSSYQSNKSTYALEVVAMEITTENMKRSVADFFTPNKRSKVVLH